MNPCSRGSTRAVIAGFALLLPLALAPAAGAVTSCVLVPSGPTTLTLVADCTTDTTIFIPDGFTLDGNGKTITAVDPPTDHFRGAVVANGGATAHVANLGVTASGLADVCDGGNDRLRGILFDGAAGSITNNVVTNINQGHSGCQEGNGIEVRNAPFDNTGNDLNVTISDNVVTGAGPVNYIAQNGIQVAFGGTAIVQNNEISGNDYTPKDTVACGMLLFDADGVKASQNKYRENERNVCNVGKGGGNFNHEP